MTRKRQKHMDIRILITHAASLKTLLALLTLGFFTIQPWHHQAADAIWLILSLISLIFVTYKKNQRI